MAGGFPTPSLTPRGRTFNYAPGGRRAIDLSSAMPKGVPVLATLEVAGGLACIALGAYYVNTLNSIVAELGMSPLGAPDFYAYFIVEGVLGAVALLLGWGIWKGKKWGLSLTADFSVASMVFYVGFGSYFVAQYNSYTELTAGAVGLGVALVAIYYLTRPKISELFSGRSAGAAPDRALPVVVTRIYTHVIT